MTDLPLRRVWHPMGHALEIATNSPLVLCAAERIWGDFHPLSDAAPVQLRVEISESGLWSEAAAVTTCLADHLIAMIHNQDNFAIADTIAGAGVIRASHDAVRNAAWFAYSLLEPIAYVLLGAKHFTMIHASAVARKGNAVLLCGPAGAGKTCLAYACAKRGWSFLTGDAAHLRRSSPAPVVIGRPFSIRFRYSAKSLFPELQHHPASLRPNGKCDFEIDPRLLGVPVVMEAGVAAVVILSRNGGRPGLTPVATGDAREVLGESICFGDAHTRSLQWKALDSLLGKPVRRLSYSDPYAAEAELRALVA